MKVAAITFPEGNWRSAIKLEASLARLSNARQALTSSNQSWEGKLDEAKPIIVPKLVAVTKAASRGARIHSPTGLTSTTRCNPMIEAIPILSPTPPRVMNTEEYLEASKTTRLHG
jgi:hypothetical protein